MPASRDSFRPWLAADIDLSRRSRQSPESARDVSAGGTTPRGGHDAALDVDDPFREWVRGRLSLETLDATKLPAAVTAFEHAVAATPEYAPAHAGLANAFLLTYESTRAQNAPNREPLTLRGSSCASCVRARSEHLARRGPRSASC